MNGDHERSDFQVRFPNGLEVSITTRGYGSETHPYEVLLCHEQGTISEAALAALGFGRDGMVGWLDSAGLGALLQKLSGAALTTVPRWEF